MRKSDRQDAILDMLRIASIVKVTDLAAYFNTSELTIRKDLNTLYNKKKLKRVYGGATQITTHDEPLFEKRKKNTEQKIAIGRKAVEFVHDGDSIFIDVGTTTESFASCLTGFSRLSVITSGINIISALQAIEGIAIYVPEGRVDPISFSITGSQAEASLKKYNARIAFIGVDGLTLEQGLLNNSYESSAISRIMLENSQKRVLLADSEKFGNIATICLCNLSIINVIITDKRIPDIYKTAFLKAGIQLVIV